MAELNYRIKEKLNEIAVKQLNASNISLHIESITKRGDSFNGEVFRISYQSTDSVNARIQKSLILKVAPQNRTQKSKLHELFLREIQVYDKILPVFHKFQLSKGIDSCQNGFNEYPNCYFSLTDEMTECIFLEDLNVTQFEMVNFRKETLTYDHMSLMMKTLGKFHAISLALKDQEPEKFCELVNEIKDEDRLESYDETEINAYYEKMLRKLTTCFEVTKNMELLQRFNTAMGEKYSITAHELVSGASAEPYAVICHGDVWTANTMFRKDDHGKPIDIKIFDYQFARYASPVTDLVVYLLCCSTKELRDKHYEDFLKIYHGSVTEFLKRLGSDPEKVFPYEVLLGHLQKFGKYACVMGTAILKIISADPMQDFDEFVEYVDHSNETEDRIYEASQNTYKKQLNDLFADAARLGYI